MNLKVKLLAECARISPPSYPGDAGYDVYSTVDVMLDPMQRLAIPLGVALEFDSDYVCLTQGKSGIARKYGLDTLGNVIDSSYRGEIHVQVVNVSDKPVFIQKGMKIAQLLFIRISTPNIQFVEELSKSDRGEKGFGSTGE
jgi:dUTP pyrophosphatase